MSINQDNDFYETRYDGIIIPHVLLGVHPKAAIIKCSQRIVEQADSLIVYGYRNFGGAYQTLKYAERTGGIRIINLAANE